MIKDVFITNFKCFGAEEKFHFSKLNLLTGINGRGKSSLLQSLLLISQTFIKKRTPLQLVLNGEWVELGTFDDIKNSSSSDELISFSFKIDDDGLNEICFQYKESPENERTATLSNLIINGEDKFVEMSTDGSTDSTNSTSPEKSLAPLDSVKPLTQFQRFHYVAADRLGPVEYVRKNDNPESLKIGIKGENLVNVLAYNEKHTVDRSVSRSQKNDLINQTIEWLGYILDGANVQVRDKADKEISILRFLLSSQNEGKCYKPNNVGFGFSYILPVIATGLIAQKGDIFIVENPEAHLHPRAQSRLTDFFARLAKSGVQIFIESHSEHILNGLRLNSLKGETNISNEDLSIYYFSENFKPEKLEVDKKGKIANWPEGFFDQQEIDLAQIFKYSR